MKNYNANLTTSTTHIPKLFLCILFITTTQIKTMEHDTNDVGHLLLKLDKDIATTIIAHCKSKNTLRQVCTYFCNLASRKNNKNILANPSLVLNQETLDHFLIYYGTLAENAVVKNLLYVGANPNGCEDNGMTILHYAMLYGYNEIADMIMKHPQFIMTDFITYHKAIYLPTVQCNHNNLTTDIFLQCAGKRIDDDSAMLCYAAKNGLYTLVQALLARGVHTDIVDKKAESPLCYATEKGHINIMKLLLDHGASAEYCINKMSALHYAAEHGYTTAVQLLIDYDAQLNIPLSERLGTPLHCAVIKNHIKIIKLLLSNEALPNISNHNGQTPLHLASYTRRTDIIKILLDYKANIDAKDKFGNAPLLCAIRGDHIETVEMLVNEGANVNMLSEYGSTSLDSVNASIRMEQQPYGIPQSLARLQAMKDILIEHGAKTKNELNAEECTIQ